MNSQSPEYFHESENTLHNAVKMDICHSLNFVQPIERTAPRVSCNINYGL